MTLALVIKELRALGRWALLAGFAAGLGLAGTLIGNRPQTLAGNDYLPVVGMIFWIGGVVMGLGVMAGDMRRGHYAFSVFRPVPRWRIFVAKFLAAAILYGAATTIATLIAVACAQTQYTHAPFDVSMLLPTLFFQIGGLAWVACGMLIVARRAMWIGSRWFPAVVPGVLALGATQLIDFRTAVIVMLAATALVLVAGAAYFAAGGEFVRLSRWARPLAALFVFGGAAAVVGGGIGVGSDILTSALAPRFDAFNFESYSLAEDGRPYRWVNDRRGTHGFYLDGTPRPEPRSEGGFEWALAQPVLMSAIDVDDPKTSYVYRHIRYSFLRSQNYDSGVINAGFPWAWHYVSARRTLEAYNDEGRYVGCLFPDGTFDTSGARGAFPPGTRFAEGRGRFMGDVLLIAPTVVYRANLGRRQVQEIYRSTPDAPILDVALLYTKSDNAELRDVDIARNPQAAEKHFTTRVVAVTPGVLHLRKLAGDESEQTIPLGAKVPIPSLTLVATGERDVAVLMEPSRRYKQSTTLITLRDGQLVTQVLPLLPLPKSRPAFWTERLPLLAMPPVMLAIRAVAIWWSDDRTWPATNGAELLMLGLGVGQGLVCVAALAVRYRLSRRATIVWLLSTLVLGVHVALTLVCLRERPMRTRCPACGKPRPMNEAICPQCGAAWPVPGDAATDVIETPRAA